MLTMALSCRTRLSQFGQTFFCAVKQSVSCELAHHRQAGFWSNTTLKMSSATGNQKPVLYGFAVSSCSWRVRAALTHKKIEYDVKTYNPFSPETTDAEKAEYRKLNPLGQSPFLVIDGNGIAQSVAMLEYLEDTRPDIPLLPRDPAKRAKVREIVELINSGIQPLQNPVVARRATDDLVKQKEWWQRYWIERGMEALENVLKASSGKYSVGDELTLADMCLVPQVFASSRYGGDVSKFPTCVRIYQDLLRLDTFSKSHPDNYPSS